jgi:hypothetical protein
VSRSGVGPGEGGHRPRPHPCAPKPPGRDLHGCFSLMTTGTRPGTLNEPGKSFKIFYGPQGAAWAVPPRSGTPCRFHVEPMEVLSRSRRETVCTWPKIAQEPCDNEGGEGFRTSLMCPSYGNTPGLNPESGRVDQASGPDRARVRFRGEPARVWVGSVPVCSGLGLRSVRA